MESIATIKNVENTLSDETFQNEVRFQRSPTINFTPSTCIYNIVIIL